MGKTKKIGNLEFRFSKERGLEWRMGEGETHRWKPKLPFGPKSGGEDSYDDGYDGSYDDEDYGADGEEIEFTETDGEN